MRHLWCVFVFLLQLQGAVAHAVGTTCSELFVAESIRDPSEHLQVAGAKVAAQVYRYFGYRVEVARPKGSWPADLTKLDTFQSRQLRLVAAFLKDHTIDEEPSVLWQTPTGELVITKLNRSLGYFPAHTKSNGKYKWIYDTSRLDSSTNIFALTQFRDIQLHKNHAWLHISQDDVVAFVQRLRSLSDEDLQIAVDRGEYENVSDREHILRSLIARRDVLVAKILELFPKLDPHSEADQIVRQLMLDKLPTPAERVERIGYIVKRNHGDFVGQLRQPPIERVRRASELPTTGEKFKRLTNEQVYAQWGGQSELNLKTSAEFKYLGKVTGLKRGDHVHLTRTMILNKRELLELFKTRLYTSHFLSVFNYNHSMLQNVYRRIGGQTTYELLEHNIGLGGTAIPTTYAVDGWSKTRDDKPLIADPKTDFFNLQVHFYVPVEAIVTVDPRQLPAHVINEPSGFGFAGNSADKESEISFFDWIPPEFISTDFRTLQSQVENGTYPSQSVNPQTGQFD